MGWGRTLLLGDIGNRLDIADTEHDIARLKRSLEGTRQRDWTQDEKIAALESENSELKLYLATIIRLLTSKGVVSAEELETMVNAIDAEDGRSDGRYDGTIA